MSKIIDVDIKFQILILQFIFWAAAGSNCKGALVSDTRDIHKMGHSPFYTRGVSKKFTKKKWSKRVRGYFKSQTKKILSGEQE